MALNQNGLFSIGANTGTKNSSALPMVIDEEKESVSAYVDIETNTEIGQCPPEDGHSFHMSLLDEVSEEISKEKIQKEETMRRRLSITRESISATKSIWATTGTFIC